VGRVSVNQWTVTSWADPGAWTGQEWHLEDDADLLNHPHFPPFGHRTEIFFAQAISIFGRAHQRMKD
jgi:hypothetical protein